MKIPELLGVSVDQAKRLTQSKSDFNELVRQRLSSSLMTASVRLLEGATVQFSIVFGPCKCTYVKCKYTNVLVDSH